MSELGEAAKQAGDSPDVASLERAKQKNPGSQQQTSKKSAKPLRCAAAILAKPENRLVKAKVKQTLKNP